MQFSTLALASVLSLAAAQTDLAGLVSSEIAGLGSLIPSSFTFPSVGLPSGFVASLSSDFANFPTDPAALSSLESSVLALATNTGELSSLAAAAATSNAASAPTGSGGSSSSSGGAAPTAVAAGGVLAAAGMVVVALL